MSGTPTRDWLAGAIRAAWREDCGDCLVGAWACPAHAAEAVCEAVRQERLFIMPQADADGLYADVQQRATETARGRVRVDVAGLLQAVADQLDLIGYEPNEAARLVRSLARLVASGTDLAEETRVVRRRTEGEVVKWLRKHRAGSADR